MSKNSFFLVKFLKKVVLKSISYDKITYKVQENAV